MALQHLAPVCQAAPASLLTVACDASASPICGPGGVSSCSGHTVEAIPDALPAAAASRKEARPSSLGPTQSAHSPCVGLPESRGWGQGTSLFWEPRVDSRRAVLAAAPAPRRPQR